MLPSLKEQILGVIEQCYEEVPNEVSVHVTSHLFEVNVESLDSNTTPQSLEAHIEFYWAELNKESLMMCNVLPEPLQEKLPSLVNEGMPQWMSMFES